MNSLASSLFDPYSPDPLGNDLFANFGDRHSLPVFGNFDPPVTPGEGGAGHPLSYNNAALPCDVSGDGWVSPVDALMVINSLKNGVPQIPDLMVEYDVPAPYLDVSGDNFVSPIDALMVIQYLKRPLNQEGEAAGEGEGGDLASTSFASSNPLAVAGTTLTGAAATDGVRALGTDTYFTAVADDRGLDRAPVVDPGSVDWSLSELPQHHFTELNTGLPQLTASHSRESLSDLDLDHDDMENLLELLAEDCSAI